MTSDYFLSTSCLHGIVLISFPIKATDEKPVQMVFPRSHQLRMTRKWWGQEGGLPARFSDQREFVRPPPGPNLKVGEGALGKNER